MHAATSTLYDYAHRRSTLTSLILNRQSHSKTIAILSFNLEHQIVLPTSHKYLAVNHTSQHHIHNITHYQEQ